MTETFTTTQEIPAAEFTGDLTIQPHSYTYTESDYTRAVDARTDFGEIFSSERREALKEFTAGAIEGWGLDPDNVLLAGFKGESLTEDVDRMKLESDHIGAGLSTDTIMEQATIDPADIDAQMKDIVQEMQRLDDQGLLDSDTRQKHVAELGRLRQEKANPTPVKDANLEDGWPVYYFTKLHGLIDDDPENNPLTYAVDDEGNGQLGVYDKRELEENSHFAGNLAEVSPRTDDQEIVATTSDVVQAALVGVIKFKVARPMRDTGSHQPTAA